MISQACCPEGEMGSGSDDEFASWQETLPGSNLKARSFVSEFGLDVTLFTVEDS
jgi:hypothetical protein